MFGQPTFGNATGWRNGVTALNGSLAPFINPLFLTRLSADIAAFTPYGEISTIVSAGFSAGFAPAGSRLISVICNGIASLALSTVNTVGGHASELSEVSITVQEFTFTIVPGGGKRGGTPTFKLHPQILQMGPSTIISNRDIYVAGIVVDDQSGMAVGCSALVPVIPGRIYFVTVNLFQIATVDIAGGAVSNIAYDFPPVFFDFI
jgi:hypothetical protein